MPTGDRPAAGRPSTTLDRRSEILPFTGLRGAAAWIVALYHFRAETPSILPQGGIIGNGEYAVDVFFIMSGYVLMASYGPQFRRNPGKSLYMRFVGYRLGRIYPAHLIVLLAYLLVPLAYGLAQKTLPAGRFEVGYLAASFLLVQNWGFHPVLEWNIPAWTISAELLFYLAFPSVSVLLHLCTARPPLLYGVGVLLYAVLVAMGWYNGLLVARIPEFGAARCVLECSLGAWLFTISGRFSVGVAASLGLQVAAVLCLALLAENIAPDFLVVPAATLLLLLSLLQDRSLVSRILSSPWALTLGRLSFATYIVHYLIKDVVKLAMSPSSSEMLFLGIYIGLVLIASAVMHTFIERPAQTMVRGWVNRFYAG